MSPTELEPILVLMRKHGVRKLHLEGTRVLAIELSDDKPSPRPPSISTPSAKAPEQKLRDDGLTEEQARDAYSAVPSGG